MDLLDNPIWSALTTRQACFAEARETAARFAPAVTLLAGLRAPDARGFDALASLLGPRELAGLFLDAAPELPASVALVETLPLVQMVQRDDAALASVPAVAWTELGERDVPEMVALAQLTRPGPFGTRTREMGTFLGVRVDGALVAMAGQRLWFEGFRELSAVCTHPDHLGRGYAAGLMAEVARRIRAAGEVPFLHSRADNARAIAVYERLGFRTRRGFRYVRVRASGR